MAELNVEPKSKNPWWIWLIVAVIILALLFFLFGGNNENRDDTVPSSDTTGVTGMVITDPNRNNLAAGTNRIFFNEEVMKEHTAISGIG